MTAPFVNVSSFVESSTRDHSRGLLGWVAIELGGLLVLDGIALRRTRMGRLTLSYPERRDSQGRRHAVIRPIDHNARMIIESAVLSAIGEEPTRNPNMHGGINGPGRD